MSEPLVSSPITSTLRGPMACEERSFLLRKSSRIIEATCEGLPLLRGMILAAGMSAKPDTSSCLMTCVIRSSSAAPAKMMSELVCVSADTVGRPSGSTSDEGSFWNPWRPWPCGR